MHSEMSLFLERLEYHIKFVMHNGETKVNQKELWWRIGQEVLLEVFHLNLLF